ncbi:MAG: patatin-like phospholipase family protein [Bacteroidetes bacterium]|nr:patatin-like phospholipase family protein [Bacteroidota bacterium]MBS1758401.1 patatin-like phospholipase family protein [Bacteroidota bacterium]
MKKALVVSGGGSKGAFAVGVIKHLVQDFALNFDVVVGTSTGSLIAPLAALGKLDILEQLYTTISNDDIIIKDNLGNRLSENSIFRVTPLWEKIKSIYTDDFFNELNQSGKIIYLNTTCLQSEELVVFTNAASPAASKYYTIKKLVNADHFRKAVLASACQPVFMTPVQVNLNVPGEQHPNYQFVDGGVREYAGVQMAIDAQAQEIFTILLSSKNPEIDNNVYTTMFPILQQTIDIFTTDVAKNDLIIPFQYNEALKYIDAVKKKMKREGLKTDDINRYFTIQGRESPFEDKIPLLIHIIQPDNPLGGGPGGLDFIPADMQQMLATGENAAANFVASLNPGEVDWA